MGSLRANTMVALLATVVLATAVRIGAEGDIFPLGDPQRECYLHCLLDCRREGVEPATCKAECRKKCFTLGGSDKTGAVFSEEDLTTLANMTEGDPQRECYLHCLLDCRREGVESATCRAECRKKCFTLGGSDKTGAVFSEEDLTTLANMTEGDPQRECYLHCLLDCRREGVESATCRAECRKKCFTLGGSDKTGAVFSEEDLTTLANMTEGDPQRECYLHCLLDCRREGVESATCRAECRKKCFTLGGSDKTGAVFSEEDLTTLANMTEGDPQRECYLHCLLDCRREGVESATCRAECRKKCFTLGGSDKTGAVFSEEDLTTLANMTEGDPQRECYLHCLLDCRREGVESATCRAECRKKCFTLGGSDKTGAVFSEEDLTTLANMTEGDAEMALLA
eukprot:jgi/Botrbrau1/9659/Bobra.0131s0031.1